MLAKAVGPGGKVIAVEPGPAYLARLRQNIDLNPAIGPRIHIEAVGVSDEIGTLVWEANPRAQSQRRP